MKRLSKKGHATRERILRAAADLFHRQGVHLTSPNDILRESRTGKSQFYHYFKSKEDLIHQVVQNFIAEIRSGRAPISYKIRSWDHLKTWFESQARLQEQYGMSRGCPYGTIASELTENDDLLRQDLTLLFELVGHELARFFLQEKASGRLEARVSEAELANFCLTSIQGTLLIGKVRRDREMVDTSIRHALRYLQSLRLDHGQKGG
jgi:AcrR family transcriptional regulator